MMNKSGALLNNDYKKFKNIIDYKRLKDISIWYNINTSLISLLSLNKAYEGANVTRYRTGY